MKYFNLFWTTAINIFNFICIFSVTYIFCRELNSTVAEVEKQSKGCSHVIVGKLTDHQHWAFIHVLRIIIVQSTATNYSRYSLEHNSSTPKTLLNALDTEMNQNPWRSFFNFRFLAFCLTFIAIMNTVKVLIIKHGQKMTIIASRYVYLRSWRTWKMLEKSFDVFYSSYI